MSTAPKAEEARLLSLDAYRGLIMIALAFNGFGLARTADAMLKKDGDSSFWSQIHYQFSHVDWQGCAFWDMIQPSFMFMVGVSMAYSYVKRESRGETWAKMFTHAFTRAIILILLGVFLSSNGAKQTNWAFMNVLSQIGLGYTFLFLMWRRPAWMQTTVAFSLLILTCLAYSFYPTPGIDVEQGNPAVNVDAAFAQKNLSDIAPQWHKNANLGTAVDVVFLNLFPRATKYESEKGGYQTINFIPSLATMIFGLICGELVRCSWVGTRKVLVLFAIGAAGIALGLLWQSLGCPIVKRIWTPSWALLSTGICCWILATLYGIIDVAGWRTWSYFLVIVGMNSIAIYMMGQLLRNWTSNLLKTHLGANVFEALGPEYAPMLNDTAVGLVFWLVCYWMYRQRIFIRV